MGKGKTTGHAFLLHWAEGPASSQAATPSKAVMAAGVVRLNSVHKASPGSPFPACTTPRAEIPITAASSCPLEKLLEHAARFW